FALDGVLADVLREAVARGEEEPEPPAEQGEEETEVVGGGEEVGREQEELHADEGPQVGEEARAAARQDTLAGLFARVQPVELFGGALDGFGADAGFARGGEQVFVAEAVGVLVLGGSLE